MKLKCKNPECLYEWDCHSEMMWATCPSCRLKVFNPKKQKKSNSPKT